MALIDSIGVSQDGSFRDRVQVALVKVALSVVEESVDIKNHTERLILAGKVLANTFEYAKKFALACAVDTKIIGVDGKGTAQQFDSLEAEAKVAADSDLETVVAAIWDAFAIAGV
jgi:hypothetical protein